MRTNRELHALGAFVHGSLTALHALGAVYNARRGNRWQCWAHVAGVAFSAYATAHHVKEAQ